MTLSEQCSDQFRELRGHFLNAAYIGPLPKRTRLAIKEAAQAQGNPLFMNYDWIQLGEKARSSISELAHCHQDQVSINCSVSEVVSSLSNGFRLASGDRIALLHGEYPSNVLPWLHKSKREPVEVDFYSRSELSDVDRFVERLHPRTKIFCFSHVCFQTGDRVDATSICEKLKNAGVLTVVDVTQSFGGMPLPEKLINHCDIVVGAAYKWLLSPYGTAFAIWSKHALDSVDHTHSGWLNMPRAPYFLTEYTVDQKEGARKFDRGQAPNMILNSGLIQSFEFLKQLGLESIYQHNQRLVQRLREQIPEDKLQVLGRNSGSNIVCFKSLMTGLKSEDLQTVLKNKNVDVSVREGNLRVSIHLFNTHDDVDALIRSFEVLPTG